MRGNFICYGGSHEPRSNKWPFKLVPSGPRSFWGALKPHSNARQFQLIPLSRRLFGGLHKPQRKKWPFKLSFIAEILEPQRSNRHLIRRPPCRASMKGTLKPNSNDGPVNWACISIGYHLLPRAM